MFSRYTDDASKQRARQRLVWLGRFLDNAIAIPGTKHRVGFDAIIGVIPGIGDVITSAASCYIVYEGWRLGAKGKQVAAMVGNVALDFVLGEIPVLGDLGDAFFKANVRNLRMLGIECGVQRLQDAPVAPEPGTFTPDAPQHDEPRKRVVNEAA
jgi:hypothetical protein